MGKDYSPRFGPPVWPTDIWTKLPGGDCPIVVLTRAFAGILVVLTGLSFIETDEWWIRVWDFPRVQILVALVLAGALSFWRDRFAGRWIALLCLVAAGWQLYRIYPYTPFATSEIAFAEDLHRSQ